MAYTPIHATFHIGAGGAVSGVRGVARTIDNIVLAAATVTSPVISVPVVTPAIQVVEFRIVPNFVNVYVSWGGTAALPTASIGNGNGHEPIPDRTIKLLNDGLGAAVTAFSMIADADCVVSLLWYSGIYMRG